MPAAPDALMTFTDCSSHQYRLSPTDILYIEADNIYSRIISRDLTLCIPYPLRLMEELMPDYFLRIHRSFLINCHSVVTLYSQTVLMGNGRLLPVPEQKYTWLKKYLDTLK